MPPRLATWTRNRHTLRHPELKQVIHGTPLTQDAESQVSNAEVKRVLHRPSQDRARLSIPRTHSQQHRAASALVHSNRSSSSSPAKRLAAMEASLLASSRARGTAWIESSQPHRLRLQPLSLSAKASHSNNPAPTASANKAAIRSADLGSKMQPPTVAHKVPPHLRLANKTRMAILAVHLQIRLAASVNKRRRTNPPRPHLVDLALKASPAVQRPQTHSPASMRNLSKTALPHPRTHSHLAHNRQTISLPPTARLQGPSGSVLRNLPSSLPRPPACLHLSLARSKRAHRPFKAAHRSSANRPRRQRQTGGHRSRAHRRPLPPMAMHLARVC